MDISPHNFVSPDEILADVLKLVKDSDHKLNSEGWYLSQIQQALEELSFDTFFQKINYSVKIPDNLRIDLPKGAFNLRELYLFNGSTCDIGSSVVVYRKRNFINGKSGNGYVARDTWSNSRDPFHTKRGVDNDTKRNTPNNLRFFSIQNGEIMLSENCRGFENVMIVSNGVMADIGDVPFVPQFFRQAVKDWVSVKALEEKAEDKIGTNEYGHWANMLARYEAKMNQPYTGSWAKAEYRAKQLNAKDRQDYKEYFTRLNY